MSRSQQPGTRVPDDSARALDPMGRIMEHLTVAGHSEPIPTSAVAASLLEKRLEETRSARGAEAADALEALVGERLGSLLEGGMPSIDLATMRSVVDFVETPKEDEAPATGLGRVVQDLKDKAAQRGMRSMP
ncbi:hypothetical protein [Brachybacterium sp. YJGR34]|uniref:hypothetical protein n=1 Tax=Brachybacterium sp. YJGR34 TaxID=2059911 RepID=UPI001E3D7D35|nr:hypothetical protein [Brachybacterium sp. YJGR34]